MSSRFTAVYHVAGSASSIEERARAIAVEQSVEMPIAAIDDPGVLSEIVGQVEDVLDREDGLFEVRVGLSIATTGLEAGQFLNMLFGNTSLHQDVQLYDVVIPAELAESFGGPHHGLEGLRQCVRATGRAMTCSALKPQGLGTAALADLTYRLACGGLDFVKDDHGLADQSYSPFAARVAACAAAVRRATDETGGVTCYVPSISGDLHQLQRQVALARDNGIAAVLIAPMVAGLPSFTSLVRANTDMAFIAHPALAGASAIAPPLLLGTLFRLFGADATIFPNHGGRFGYSPATCRTLAAQATRDLHGLRRAVPVPAGGMTLQRIPEMLDFYGADVLLLIGGALLSAGDRLTEVTAEFTTTVRDYRY